MLSEAQRRVGDWVRTNFGDGAMELQERAGRVLEEAIELAQAEGLDASLVHRMADHVYQKPAGEPWQEVGGIGVCLLAWADASKRDLEFLIEQEIDRIHTKTAAHFRARHQVKVDAGIARKALEKEQADG